MLTVLARSAGAKADRASAEEDLQINSLYKIAYSSSVNIASTLNRQKVTLSELTSKNILDQLDASVEIVFQEELVLKEDGFRGIGCLVRQKDESSCTCAGCVALWGPDRA